MCCERRRPLINFRFQYGTVVRARNFRTAVEILRGVNINNPRVIHLGDENWQVLFDDNVTHELSTPTSVQAAQVAGWALYLDRRERLLRPNLAGECI